jgi:hypothetical protein
MTNRRRQFLRAAVGLPSVVALVFAAQHIVQLATIFGRRISYPYDLEWMEGGQLYHAYRVMHGLPLYGDCSDGWISFAYPPMHAWVLATVGSVVGLDYLAARLVSIAAFLVTVWLLTREVTRAADTHVLRWVTGCIAVAMMASTFPVTGAWLDIIRVDSLYIALLMGGALLSLPAPPPAGSGARVALATPRLIFAAVLLTAAVLTKQSAALFLPWICGYAIWRHVESGVRLSISCATMLLASLGGLTLATDGHFFVLVFGVMSKHPLLMFQFERSVITTMIYAPYLVLVPLLASVLLVRRKLGTRVTFWFGMLICGVAVSWVTSAKVGAYTNNLMSMGALTGPVTAMVCARWLSSMPRRRGRRMATGFVLAALAALALWNTDYESDRYVPTAKERAMAEDLNRYVATLGDVVMPSHSFIPVRNGITTPQVHEQGYIDVMGSGIGDLDVVRCLAGVRGRWLILDDVSQPHFVALMRSVYEKPTRIPSSTRVVTGQYTVPNRLLSLHTGAAAHVPRHNVRPLFDFEGSHYSNWGRDGNAFEHGPTAVLNGYQTPISGQRGLRVANSFSPLQFDAAVGRLRSPEFVIDRSHMSFRVGGGNSPRLRVQLHVDGKVVREVRGVGKNFEMMAPFVWDLADLEGQKARLWIIDMEEAGWGHLMVDAVDLFDGQPGPR